MWLPSTVGNWRQTFRCPLLTCGQNSGLTGIHMEGATTSTLNCFCYTSRWLTAQRPWEALWYLSVQQKLALSIQSLYYMFA